MFATLAGGYPAAERPTDPDPPAIAAPTGCVREVLADQVEAGLGLLTDGWVDRPDPVDALGRALLPGGASVPARERPADRRRLVIRPGGRRRRPGQAMPARPVHPRPAVRDRRADARAGLTLALADVLAGELADLAAAGCPFIQVDEDGAVPIGSDETERRLFADAQARLLAGLAGAADRPHVSLAISGGNADTAGPETIFGPAYDSHLFDLIAGPDNWRLITRAPGRAGDGPRRRRRSIADRDDQAGRRLGGRLRGVGRARRCPDRRSPRRAAWRGLPREVARAEDRPARRGRSGIIERRDEEAIAASLDPRAVDARSAALGAWRVARGGRPRARWMACRRIGSPASDAARRAILAGHANAASR